MFEELLKNASSSLRAKEVQTVVQIKACSGKVTESWDGACAKFAERLLTDIFAIGDGASASVGL